MNNSKKIGADVVVVRKMLLQDCQGAAETIQNGSFKNSVLPVTPKQLMQWHKRYWVGLYKGKVIATIGFKLYQGGLTEIRSLVVSEKFRGSGIGHTLIDLCLTEIHRRKYRSVLVLTVAPKMFEAKGFKHVDIQCFHQKIATDCKYCPHGYAGPDDHRCREKALFLILKY